MRCQIEYRTRRNNHFVYFIDWEMNNSRFSSLQFFAPSRHCVGSCVYRPQMAAPFWLRAGRSCHLVDWRGSVKFLFIRLQKIRWRKERNILESHFGSDAKPLLRFDIHGLSGEYGKRVREEEKKEEEREKGREREGDGEKQKQREVTWKNLWIWKKISNNNNSRTHAIQIRPHIYA